MGAIITAQIIGSESVLAGITAFQQVVANLRPFWREVFAPKFYADLQDRFALEGQGRAGGGKFGGGHWAPLSPAYKAWKDKHFPGKTILDRTGALRASLSWNGSGPGPGGYFEATPTLALVGTRIPYSRYHTEGTSRMPARPHVSPADPAQWAPLLRQWIVREAKKKTS